MNEALKRLEVYFKEFIEDLEIREELIFCLTQSQVELFVRSKFAYWVLHIKKFPNSFCLIETNRIDLVIQIEGNKYCLEFGHQINLLKHTPSGHKNKIDKDCEKLADKLKTLSKKIEGFNLENNLCCCTISLFTDFHLEKIDNKISVKYISVNPDYKSGVFAKYGTKVTGKRSEEYHHNYKHEFKDYSSHVLIDDALTFHWKIKECEFNN
jgi:hypothetical protein